jgi:hypothetical protein
MNIRMRLNVIPILVVSFFLIMPLTSQGNAATTTVELTYQFSNLANPGNEHYEGWLIVDGNAVTTGKFTVDSNGNLKDLNGNAISGQTVPEIDISKVSKYVLTLEPSGDTDIIPSSVKPIAGDFSNNIANLSHNLGVSLDNIAGGYILATPSDGAGNNENSGIWYLDPNGGPGPSLTLPDLSETAWVYEGWIVLNDIAVTTGRFNTSSEFDSFDGYSGDQGYPPFPGEDFIKNAPSGLNFPTDFSGGKAVISIEPRIDNSPEPFQFKPLVADIPNSAMDHHLYTMTDASDTLATGKVTMKEKTSNAAFEGSFEAFLVLLGISSLVTIKRKSLKK